MYGIIINSENNDVR